MDYAGGMPDRCAADQKRDLAFGELAEIDTSASIRDGEQTGRDVVQDDSLQGSIALSWVVIRDKHRYALFVVSSVRPAAGLARKKTTQPRILRMAVEPALCECMPGVDAGSACHDLVEGRVSTLTARFCGGRPQDQRRAVTRRLIDRMSL